MVWNRQTESHEQRLRRVTLIREGLTHPQVDEIFESEIKKTTFKHVQESKSESLRDRLENLLSFEEWRSQEQNAQINGILGLIESEIEKRLEVFNELIKFYRDSLKKITTNVEKQSKEYGQDIHALMQLLREEETRLKKDREQYLEASKRCDLMYDSYKEEMQKANEVITTYNEKIVGLNKRIQKENKELERLRRTRA